jgi:hypothetical protein
MLDENGDKIQLKSGEYKSRKISTVDWADKDRVEVWREAWAKAVNTALENNNHPMRVDHRSYQRQGIDKIPSIHLGAAVSQMEKRGIKTERGDVNRSIADMNKEIRQTKARIKKVKTWLYSQPIQNAPSFLDIIKNIADVKNLDNDWKRIASLKTQASVLVFLQDNNINSMEQFVDKVTKISEGLQAVSVEIKKSDRRLDTLEQHLSQVEIYKQRKAIYRKYKELDGKKANAFYDKHFEAIQEYDAANKYLKAVLNGRTSIPVNKWKKEQETLKAHRCSLAEKFYSLKEEVKMTEQIRKGAERIIGEQSNETQRIRSKDIGRG